MGAEKSIPDQNREALEDLVLTSNIELARKEIELTRAFLRAWKIYQLFNPRGEFSAIFTKNTLDEALDSILTLAQNVLFDNERCKIEKAKLVRKASVLLREIKDSSIENRNLKIEVDVLNRSLRRTRKRFR